MDFGESVAGMGSGPLSYTEALSSGRAWNSLYGGEWDLVLIEDAHLSSFYNSNRLRARLIREHIINRARGPYEEIFVLTFKAYDRTQ